MANEKLSFQRLERRIVLDAVAWVGPNGGDWNLAANWFDSTIGDNRVPTGKDNVSIDTGGSTATVNILPGDNLTVGSLAIGSNDALSIARGSQLTVNGTFTQASGSALDFSLNGSRAGLDYGLLDVQGSALLGGTINVTLAAGYSPGPDDTYQPLLFASETGTPTVNDPAGETDFLTQTSLYVLPAGSAILSVTNTADSGSGSLRAAITTANASSSPVDLLTFDIPTSDPGYSAAGGVWTIAPRSALPTVTAPAIIDAATQPGYAGKPVVQLAGGGAGSNVNGLNMNGGHSRVSGLAVGGFNGNGIELSGFGFDTLANDFLGTDTSGNAALTNSGNGIFVDNVAKNTIGGTTPGLANVVSGNGANGIFINGADASDNLVEGNFIGTNIAGVTALGNSESGVVIRGAATENRVGGTAAGAFNVISGNGQEGVWIGDAGTSNNLAEGNEIGTNAAGTAALGNIGNGVAVQNGATNNTVGGAAAGAGNVISGNVGSGVSVSGAGTSANLVEGNHIGIDTSGAVAIGNAGNGVQIAAGATNNTVGGTTPGTGNVISGNDSSAGVYGGVFISGIGTSGNMVAGNFIGTSGDGTTAVGNGWGVVIRGAATKNIIGAETTTGASNIISGNASGGVWIGDAGTSQNEVEGNYIGTNATGAVALGNGGYGVTIQASATNNTVGGTAAGGGNTISGNVSAGVWIGDAGTSNNLVEGNDIGTNAAGSAALGNHGYGVTIQSGAANNTIGGVVAGDGNVISGNGTPANGNGGVFIGGTGTSGNLLAGNFIGTDAAGNAALGNSGWGVVISGAATNNAIGDASPGAANIISGNADDGIWIGNAGTSHNLVEGNFIGTDAAGNVALGNGRNGVAIQDGATGNAVGGTAAGAANTIAFNKIDGVLIDGGAQNLVSQNSMRSNGHLGIELADNGNNNQAAPALVSASGNNKTTVVGSLSGAPNTTFTLEFFANPAGSDEGQTFVGTANITTNADGSEVFSILLPVALPANQQIVTATATDPNKNTSPFSNGVSATATPFTLNEDVYVIGSGAITISAANGVLSNDTGPTQLTVTSTTVTGTEGGTFTFNADGSFTYTPPASFSGFDYAKYTAKDTSGDTGTATVNVLSQSGGIVWKFYEQVLHRDPDYAGLQGWLGDFNSGGKPGDIALGFFESTELLNQIITGYYHQYLGRAPQGNDLSGWESVWRETGGPEGIKAGFAASPEFNALAGNKTGDNPAGWITALYERILNRNPQGNDLPFWEQALASGTSEYQAALDFFTSLEAYDNDVTGWFYEYLERAPTLAEQGHYANQMSGGLTDRDIEQAVTNLAEYSANPPASPPGSGVRLPDYFD